MHYASCGLGMSVPGICRCSSNLDTASPADGIRDIYLILCPSDASGCDYQV